MADMLGRWRRTLTVLLVLVGFGATTAQAQGSAEGAEAFLADIGDRTIAVLATPDLSAEDLRSELEQIFVDTFDTRTIGRFVLGRYWNDANDAQREEYLDLFQALVVDTYARRFRGYQGERFNLVGTRQINDTDYLVTTQIFRPNGGPAVNVDWRVRASGDGYAVIDVIVERVNMTITYRNEFGAIIQRSGGNIEGLLDALRNRETDAG
ncbi:MAG: ABC transporter substrate-binding protein [Rhodospirillaceae bacterium]|nr:ABC transporter substrate-binding protein [Rhodospirillaceae bacterium]